MTTEVEIRANHGWPVRVTVVAKSVSPGVPDPKPQSLMIPAGEKRTMYVHSHADLIIHEIQPDEEGFAGVGIYGGTLKATDKVEVEIVRAQPDPTEPVVQRVVTGYIDPITADKINL